MGRLRRLRDLYDAQYSRRRHRRHLRADRHSAGHLRAAGVHGRGRPRLSSSHFTTNGWAGADSFSGLALPGMFAAIPFAIWFFLAIEGPPWRPKAKDPQRTIPRALGGGILTLTVLAIGVMVFAGGVGDWRRCPILTIRCPRR